MIRVIAKLLDTEANASFFDVDFEDLGLDDVALLIFSDDIVA